MSTERASQRELRGGRQGDLGFIHGLNNATPAPFSASVPVQLVHALRRLVGALHRLEEEEAGGGQAGDGEEAQDGGVQRGVGLDDVKHGVLVDILEDGAHLQAGERLRERGQGEEQQRSEQSWVATTAADERLISWRKAPEPPV